MLRCFASSSLVFQIHRGLVIQEETRLAKESSRRKDVSFEDALQDPETRATYIRRVYR